MPTTQDLSYAHTLTGRTALVTGAGTGIGAATAIALASAGTRIGLIGRRADRLDEVAERIAAQTGHRDRAFVAIADVADRARLDEAVTRARSEFGSLHSGRIDKVTNCAGALHLPR